jgi:hypothetical protein
MWDEELDQLVIYVGQYLGEEVLDTALERAVACARRLGRPLTRHSRSASHFCDKHIDSIRIVPEGALEHALKVELRRVIRPH